MRKKEGTFAEKLLQGAKEAAAIARGDVKPARVTRRTMTGGATQVQEPPRYNAARIRKLRERLNMSQPVFARSLNASAATVKAWEQGKRVPDGTSLRLLELAEKEPDLFVNIVGVRPALSRRSFAQPVSKGEHAEPPVATATCESERARARETG